MRETVCIAVGCNRKKKMKFGVNIEDEFVYSRQSVVGFDNWMKLRESTGDT